MLTEIKSLLTSIDSSFIQLYAPYDEANISVDNQEYDKNYVLIEEFTDYSYILRSNSRQKMKVVKVRLYIYTFTQLENSAETRETQKETLDTNFVKPLFDKLSLSPLFNTFNCFCPPVPRFDGNETGIVVEFDYPINVC